MIGDVAGKQMNLLGDGPAWMSVEASAISKTLFYNCVSMLQKSIRRGAKREALLAARVLFIKSDFKLKARLRVIMLEDIGLADIDGVISRIRMTFGRSVRWNTLESVVEWACAAKKSRDTDDLCWGWIWPANESGWTFSKALIPDRGELDYAVSVFKAPAVGRWDLLEAHAKEESNACLALVRELRTVEKSHAELSLTAAVLVVHRWDSDANALSKPVGWELAEHLGVEPILPRCWIPRVAVDGHVLQGKLASAEVGKEIGWPEKKVGNCYFALHSAELVNRVWWQNDWRRIAPDPSKDIRDLDFSSTFARYDEWCVHYMGRFLKAADYDVMRRIDS